MMNESISCYGMYNRITPLLQWGVSRETILKHAMPDLKHGNC